MCMKSVMVVYTEYALCIAICGAVIWQELKINAIFTYCPKVFLLLNIYQRMKLCKTSVVGWEM